MRIDKAESGIYYGTWYYENKRIRRSLKTKNVADARRAAKKIDQELYDQFVLGIQNHTWNEAVESYMIGRELRASYGHDLDRIRWLDGYLGGVPLSKITKEKQRGVLQERIKEVSASTANRLMNFVSAVMHHAEEIEWIVRAPKTPKAEVVSNTPAYLTPDEVNALIAELAKSPRTKHLVAFVTFAIATGLRMRNITHLEWNRIDLSKKVLFIDSKSSKNKKPITVPLLKDSIAVIRSQIGKHDTRVFTHRGKPYDRVNPRTLRKAAKAAGIEKHLHPHLFRHTFASWHVMSGTTLFDLMELGGWRKIDSVLVYAHLSADHLQAVAANRQMIDGTYIEAMKVINAHGK